MAEVRVEEGMPNLRSWITRCGVQTLLFWENLGVVSSLFTVCGWVGGDIYGKIMS